MHPDDVKTYALEGDESSMISQNIVFRIDRCIPKDGKICKSNKEIDDFVYDIEVGLWAIEEKFDTEHMDEGIRPTFYANDLIDRVLLNTGAIQIVNSYLSRNVVETYDNPVNIVFPTIEDEWYEIAKT